MYIVECNPCNLCLIGLEYNIRHNSFYTYMIMAFHPIKHDCQKLGCQHTPSSLGERYKEFPRGLFMGTLSAGFSYLADVLLWCCLSSSQLFTDFHCWYNISLLTTIAEIPSLALGRGHYVFINFSFQNMVQAHLIPTWHRDQPVTLNKSQDDEFKV